ncbi:hypothetical protein [Microbacterium resistens]|uniref:hypothetical protein n=1 Tax=Microbacterium resistens TaxID=156977 RepID=UPI0036708C46
MAKVNDDWFDDLLVSPELHRVVETATEAIADEARSIAPVDTRAYKDGIVTAVKHQERVVGLVQATDAKSLIIESTHGVLARAVKAVSRRARRP